MHSCNISTGAACDRNQDDTRCHLVRLTSLQDPVSEQPSVLVKRYNISQQKELELQLSIQQAALQRWVPAVVRVLLVLSNSICVASVRPECMVKGYVVEHSLNMPLSPVKVMSTCMHATEQPDAQQCSRWQVEPGSQG